MGYKSRQYSTLRHCSSLWKRGRWWVKVNVCKMHSSCVKKNHTSFYKYYWKGPVSVRLRCVSPGSGFQDAPVILVHLFCVLDVKCFSCGAEVRHCSVSVGRWKLAETAVWRRSVRPHCTPDSTAHTSMLCFSPQLWTTQPPLLITLIQYSWLRSTTHRSDSGPR